MTEKKNVPAMFAKNVFSMEVMKSRLPKDVFKKLMRIMEQGEAAIRKTAIMGALALYLDFINLFLMLLRLFGGSRD